MQTSGQIDQIATALSMAQRQFPVLSKSTQGYGYKYADMAEVVSMVGPILSKEGLSLTHWPEHEMGEDFLVSMLMHTSGQFIRSRMKVVYKAEGKINANQAWGGALTYAKRYAITSILNLAADADDDGRSSLPTEDSRSGNQDTPVGNDEFIDEKEREQLVWRFRNYPDLWERCKASYKIEDLSQLKKSEFPRVLKVLKDRFFEDKNKGNSQ